MKRKILAIITIMLALVLGLTACGNLGTVKVVGKQDTSYIVLSNGGSAVQYGNYTYFINGSRGYEDEKGKSNVFGKIEKGGIYRAEFDTQNGKDEELTYNFSFGDVKKKTFVPARNSDTFKMFKTTTKNVLKGYEKDDNNEYRKDDNDEYIEIREEQHFADVQLIAPKTVGTVSGKEGGIFIFDDYIFYASPSNKKNRSGDVQTQKTEFYRAKLDGSKTELVFTSDKDTSGSAYMFYKYSGAYYLVVQDGTDVKSVKMDNKIRDAVTIATGVSAVHFPNKGMYYAGMPENTVEDFVYFLRTPTKDDPSTIGNILEMKRPDGSNSKIVSGGVTASMHGTNGGVFFYEVSGIIHYTNFADTTGFTNLEGKEIVVSDKLTGISTSSYTWIKPVVASNKNLSEVYVLASDANGLYIINRAGNVRELHDIQSTLVAVSGGTVYFNSGKNNANGNVTNMLLSVEMFMPDAEVYEILETDNVSDDVTFKYDILPDFAVFFADIDDMATDYIHYKELSDPSAEAFFVGHRIDSETIPEEDLYPEDEE